MPPTSQQHYPSHPARRNERNRDRGSGNPLGNGRHTQRFTQYGGSHGTQGHGEDGPPDDPYGGSLDISSSS